MQFYKVIGCTGPHQPNVCFCSKQSDAHVLAKEDDDRVNVRIELIEVPLDKDTVLQLLNDEELSLPALRTWRLTPRGGLVEVPDGQ